MRQRWIVESIISVLQVALAVVLVQLTMMDWVGIGRVHVVSQPLLIHMNQQSPPYIALQEVLGSQTEITKEPEHYDDSTSIKLNANQIASLKLEPLKIKSRHFAAIKLPSLKLSRYAYLKSEDEPENIAEAGIDFTPPHRVTFIESQWVDQLSPRQRERLRVASQKTQVLAQDWSIPDFQDLVQIKLFALASEPQANTNNSGIIVRSPILGTEEHSPIPMRNPAHLSHGEGIGHAKDIDSRDSESTIVAAASPTFLTAGAVEVRPKRKVNIPIRITGPVFLSGGLALAEGGAIEVFREEEGYRIEEASVDLAKGNYEIDLPARFGKLVAQLINSDGTIVGRGEINIADTDDVIRAQGIYEGLKLSLKPYKEGLAGVTASAYSFGKTQYPVASQLAAQGLEALFVSDEDGQFHLPVLSPYSSIMVRAFSPTHAEGLTSVVAGSSNEIQLMPDEMLSALERFLKELGWEMGSSVQPTLIWGRVIEEGTPVAGVRVASEMSPNLYPLYFGEDYLPNPKLDSTSANGLFVFVGLPAGFHPLVALKNERYWSHGNVPVTTDAMSYSELTGTKKLSATDVISFDSITKEPVSAQLTLQSIDELINVPKAGLLSIDLPSLHRQSFLIHRGDDTYLPTLHSYVDSQDYIYVPLVSREWWNSLEEDFENKLEKNGHILGHVEGDDFSVQWSDGKGTEINPIYFDSAGFIVESGVAGGGFIFPNLKPGSGSLIVLGKNDPFVHSQLSAAEKGIVSVHYFQLGRF